MHTDQQRTRSVRAAEPPQLSEKRAQSKEQKMQSNISGKCRTGNVLKQLVGGVGGMEYFLHGGSKGTTKNVRGRCSLSQLRRLISNFFFIFIDELITALMSKNDFI